jgi:glycosyltransferase involved in cell wall biosynthesis
MIRVAFPLFGHGQWMGGLVYLQNTLRLVRERLAGELETVLVLSADEDKRFGAELSPLANETVVDDVFESWGRGGGLTSTLVLGRDRRARALLTRARVDVGLEDASFYGWRPGMGVLAWIPDFQHRFMPEMFSRQEWWRRDIGFRVQIASGRTIMVSSKTACADCERFYPAARGRIRVVRFAAGIDPSVARTPAASLREKYGLPERFIFLPNQFWRHKNHELVVDALLRLRAEGRLDNVMPIIASGHGEDPRHPGHFEALARKIADGNLSGHFQHLGTIPYSDVLGLVAVCDHLINPSRFEGWSTTIEEAKALGARILLSDLPVHREQAPDAIFFSPRSDIECAEALLAAAARGPAERPSPTALAAAHERRLQDHAEAFLDAVRAARIPVLRRK